MCVQWTNDWEIATKDITAYKFVVKSKGRFGRVKYHSPLPLGVRASQEGGPVGSILTYPLKKTVRSELPGIYCTANAIMVDAADGMVCLVVKIPKGTKFRRGRAVMGAKDGQQYEVDTINALAVVPVRECSEKDEYPELRPTKPIYSTAPVWYYATNATTSVVNYWTTTI